VHCSVAPIMLRADGDAITQLLTILLDNAVRHTASGGNVWVTVTPQPPYHALIVVSDDGEGLPLGAHERIFDRFYQADPARQRGGAGLGLSIARWIAREHHGDVTATSNAAGGATFTVTLSSIS